MAECETNYRRIGKLLPKDADAASFRIVLPNKQVGRVQLQVTERCKYTTMVRLDQITGSEWLDQHFELRLYHDARMVEVMPKSGTGQLRGRYDYPNENMWHEDEKHQQHKFLSECLSYCLAHGLSAHNPEIIG
ncbi:Uncharacterised protein [BD1-7 clade bacterium]|uniref:DUF1249 domain-containing protein n=1 Tax=BD1-7 clade bacterium TaxID=2029982 RepID=A0A5S9N8P7_9GAMM|nr:Uncharacterised protein [BD1-7 clade bacterium]CAA0082271.1 Uncharacterised protein [BD1-7 clade bacterium]CAA0085567.1 Uncharacterised protein [BD1-7 clade bacterium]